jgi:predicted chitinase
MNPSTAVLVSAEQLLVIMPKLELSQAEAFVPSLNAAMFEFEIVNRARISAFLAQLAHESWQLRKWVEMAHSHGVPGCSLCATKGPHKAGEQYEGRIALGNTQPGDGVKFAGRGPIQLTGRANYEAAARAIKVADLVKDPAVATKPEVGFRIAGWYWQSRGCNPLADQGDFREITRKINGGFNGLEDRERYWATAKTVFGLS